MVLYIFITHQKNIQNCYTRISTMMKEDFIVVNGGFDFNIYNEDTNVLELDCDDSYAGLPEKVIKAFHFISNDDRFNKYTHYFKLDDDMILNKRIEYIEGDYMGNVHYAEGSRTWHIGRCNNEWNNKPYSDIFVPWCLGGFGYIISKSSIIKITPNYDFKNHIYEDLYIAILLNKINIHPKQFNVSEYIHSPIH